MEYLLHPRNLKILESFCLARPLFAFDYDGTLAPIAARPEMARMSDATAGLLRKLSERAPFAVITGRSVADIGTLLPVKPHFLIGNHGAEGTHTPEELGMMSRLSRTWLSQIDDLRPVMEKFGVVVEDKTYSLSFHYRNSLQPDVAQGFLELLLSRLEGSRITSGKCVVNVLPEFSLDKGAALSRIMKENQYQFGIYFGDDQTDEDVFHHHNARLLTVKIGNEPSEARYYLESQSEIDSVLTSILSYL